MLLRLARTILSTIPVALVAAALLAPPAGGSSGAGAYYGGGSDPSRSQNVVTIVALKTDPASGTFDLWLDASDFNCTTPADAQVMFTLSGIQIAPDGSFSSAGSFDNVYPGGTGGTYTLAGRFAKRNLAVGTITISAGSCDMGQLAWRAADPAAAGGSGRKGDGRTYAGYFSQRSVGFDVHMPLTLRLTATGRGVAGLAAHVNLIHPATANCAAATHFAQIWFGGVHGDGFTGHQVLGPVPGPQAGESITVTIDVHGRFGAHRATGTWHEVGDVRRTSDGSLVQRCDSGKLTWQAIAAG